MVVPDRVVALVGGAEAQREEGQGDQHHDDQGDHGRDAPAGAG